ncbi:MAG: tetratricopeptide repeat protein [Planctomycetes bacterium]|nr:tetratricopeptide repeat protein [Planctomycetota bacterium]
MRFARFIRRVDVGLAIAISLVAIGPLVAVAQHGNMHASPNGYPTVVSPSAGIRGSSGAPPKREALFQNGQFNWPKMPFTRSKASQRSPMTAQQAQSGRAMPKNAMPLPQRFTAGQPNGMTTQSRTPRAQGQRASTNRSMRPNVNANARTGVPPQRMTMNPSTPTLASPRTTPAMPPMPSPPKSALESPAVRILAQAHEWSTSAESEDDFSRIIETCRQAQANQPTPAIGNYANDLTAWALNRRGQLRADEGRAQEAMSDFDAAIEADANRWRAIHNRGVLLAQAGQFKKAFDDFTRTIHINPKFAKAYSNRGALFVVAGRIAPAVQDYKQAIELDPDLAVAHRGLARACHLNGQLEEAIRYYDEVVRLSPNDAYAVASRADVLTDLGRYADASTEYERAIEIDSNSSHAHTSSAWLLATCPDDAIRNPQLAIERAQTAMKLTGDRDAASLDTLAAAQASAGDFAAAKQTVEQAVQLASAAEKEAFQERLSLYQHDKPYRISPIEVAQAIHEEKTK